MTTPDETCREEFLDFAAVYRLADRPDRELPLEEMWKAWQAAYRLCSSRVKHVYLEGCSAGRWPNPDDEEAYEEHWQRSDARKEVMGI